MINVATSVVIVPGMMINVGTFMIIVARFIVDVPTIMVGGGSYTGVFGRVRIGLDAANALGASGGCFSRSFRMFG